MGPLGRVTLREARSVAERLKGRRTLLARPGRVERDRPGARDADGVAHLHAEARTIAAAIADHFGRPELRAAFLSLPLVSALFASVRDFNGVWGRIA